MQVAVKLDDLDRRIILLLQEDGRMSASDISRRLGNVGERGVRYRIDRLVRSRVISIIAVVNAKRVGYSALGDVIIELPPQRVRQVLSELAEDELVCYLGANLQRGTITLQIAAHDEYEFHSWVRALIESTDGAALVKSTVVRQVAKDSDLWPPPRV